jgi:hypothetical protein
MLSWQGIVHLSQRGMQSLCLNLWADVFFWYATVKALADPDRYTENPWRPRQHSRDSQFWPGDLTAYRYPCYWFESIL